MEKVEDSLVTTESLLKKWLVAPTNDRCANSDWGEFYEFLLEQMEEETNKASL